MRNSIKHDKQLDLKNGDTLLCDDIRKEKYNLLVELNILEDNDYPPHGLKKSRRHWMSNIKMDYTRKERWFKEAHQSLTLIPQVMLYL